MIEKELEIKNKLGMHIRSAAFFVKIAKQYKADIFIKKNNEKINAKSLMSILMLEIKQGDKIKVLATGDDENQLIEAIEKLVIENFYEEE